LKLGDGFLWGCATSAHQVEGNNVASDWWEWEQTRPDLCAEPSGDACDHYHLYGQDMAILRALGFNCYRFSVEWARIEPEKGLVSRAALDHYKRMLDEAHRLGLVTILTLHHFTSPRWATRAGGFTDIGVKDAFKRYLELVARELGGMSEYFTPINEPNIVALAGYRMGTFPPGKATKEDRRAATAAFCELHGFARDAIKASNPAARVGLSLSMTDYQPMPGAEDRVARIREIMEDVYLASARGDDFIGVQCYTRDRVPPSGVLPPDPERPLTEMGYETYPEALGACIRRAHAATGLPVLVTENGIAPVGDDDEVRIAFVRRALAEVARAIQEGLPVWGYVYWSLLDNFEWNLGYRPRFGLVAVDRSSQRRVIKRSAVELGAIALRNELPDEIG
jgi:beta-glucosidase